MLFVVEFQIENKVLPVKEEEEFKISVFGFAAVVPAQSSYKPGANITPKRFGEIATEAGTWWRWLCSLFHSPIRWNKLDSLTQSVASIHQLNLSI